MKNKNAQRRRWHRGQQQRRSRQRKYRGRKIYSENVSGIG